MALTSGQVAVVAPVFNDAENVRACVTALGESRGPMPVEIVVVDDGSTDATADVARSCGARVVRTEENRGQSWARNRGAQATDSEYILFVDSDVIVPGGCFAAVSEFIEMDRPKALIGLQGVFSLEHPHAEWASLIYNTLQHLLSRAPRYSSCVNTSFFLVARNAFQEVGGFREDVWFMEDNEFAQRMTAKGMYVLRGSVEFVHAKRVTWRWLVRTHILGGKMQDVLAGLKPRHAPSKNPRSAGANHVFAWKLLAGAMALATLAVAALAQAGVAPISAALAPAGICFACLVDCRVFLRVRRNPLFLLAGTLTLLVAPWLIVLGRASAHLRGAGPHERDLWRRSGARGAGE